AVVALGGHVEPAPAGEDRAGVAHHLVGQRDRALVLEGPLHRVVGARDEAVERHHHVPEDPAHWSSGVCTRRSVFPSWSRNQNIGGTGSPMRLTSGSTSTPRSRSS